MPEDPSIGGRLRWAGGRPFLILALGLAIAGCQTSSSAESGSERGTRKASGERMCVSAPRTIGSGTAYAETRAWLPPDPVAAVVLSPDGGIDWLRQLFPDAAETSNASALGSFATLEREYAAILQDNLGYEFSESRALALGFGQKWTALVALGDLDPGDKLREVQVQGRTVYKFEDDSGRGGSSRVPGKTWALPVDDPSRGVVVFANRPDLERAIRSRKTEGDATSESTPGPFEKHFDRVGQTVLAAALQPSFGEQPVPLPFVRPQSVMVAVDTRVRISVRGDQQTLDSVQSYVDEQKKRLLRELAQPRSDRASLGREFAMATGRHLVAAYAEQLEPIRDEGLLLYDLKPPAASTAPLAAAGLVGASIFAVRDFRETVVDARAAEAEAVLSKMADGSIGYFTTEQHLCGTAENCSQPWHDGKPAREPVPSSEYVFPGGTDAKFVTSKQVPEGGEKLNPNPEVVRGDVPPEAILSWFGLRLDAPLYYKYSYTTGRGSGADASATIKAIADFDPSTAEKHTIIQTLSVEDGSPRKSARYVEHQFH